MVTSGAKRRLVDSAGVKREESDEKKIKLEDEELLALEDHPPFAWQTCHSADEATRIAIKERALLDAVTYTEQLFTTLEKHMKQEAESETDALKIWMDDIRHLKQLDKQFEVLVGVAGRTGAGKTSLLNSLLGISELLPSGHERAATSVVCQVSWNHDERPDYGCRAVVSFRSVEDMAKELRHTLVAIRDVRDIEEGEYDNEDERAADLAEAAFTKRQGLERIQAVWPSVADTVEIMALQCKCDGDEGEEASGSGDQDEAQESGDEQDNRDEIEDEKHIGKEDGNEQSADNQDEANKYEGDIDQLVQDIVMSNPTIVAFLEAGSREFHGQDHEKLAKTIKPFLDSTEVEHGLDDGIRFAAWPLIKSVHIFLKSDVLKSGVSLVDLPGNGDNIDSRSDVARDFITRLDVTMIVAQIIRASNEKSTLALMDSHQKLCQSMNHIFNKRCLGVVLSKMEDIDAELVVRRSEEASNNGDVHHHQVALACARRELSNIKQDRRQSERTIAKKRKQITSVRVKIERRARPQQMAVWKKSLAEDEELLKITEQHLLSLSSKESRQCKIVKTSRAFLAHWAIKTRNASVSNRIQNDYIRRKRQSQRSTHEKGSLDTTTENGVQAIDVMATSCRAFWALRDKGKGPPGVPTEGHTGIPFVKQWIHKATAHHRERHLDLMLSGYAIALAGLDRWCGSCKLGDGVVTTVAQAEEVFQEVHAMFNQALEARLSEFHGAISKLNPIPDPKGSRSKFATESKTIANGWSRKYPEDDTKNNKLHWMSYRAVCQREGGPFKSSGVEGITYDWITPLTSPLLMHVAEQWASSIKHRSKQIMREVYQDMGNFWQQYIQELDCRASDINIILGSYLVQSLNGLKESILEDFHKRNKEALRGFLKNPARILEQVGAQVRAELQEPFRDASRYKGKGSHGMRRNTVEGAVHERCHDMFHKAAVVAQEDMGSRRKALALELSDVACNFVRTMQTHIRLTLDNALSDSNTKQRMTLQARIGDLKSVWHDKWQTPEQPLEHILLKDCGIPDELPVSVKRTAKKRGEEQDDDDDDSEDDSSSSEDESD